MNAPDTLGDGRSRTPRSARPRRPRAGAPGTALPDAPAVLPEPPPGRGRRRSASRTAPLGAYARCGYRFYLERVLGLPRVAPPPPDEVAPRTADEVAGHATRGCAGRSCTRCSRTSTSRGPRAPAAEAVAELAAAWGLEPTAAELEDVRALVAAFARSPLCARLASARRTRTEAPFSFTLDPAGGGPLVTGFVDVVAHEPDGGALVVDYKSDRLEDATPADVVERDYATQRLVYALAALRDGAPRAEVAYCFLERPDEPVTATFTDADALAERLAGLAARPARRPLRGHRRAPPRAVRRLPGPRRCARTRERRSGGAGSLAGSSGPSWLAGDPRRRSTAALSSAPKTSTRFVR